LQEKEGKGKEVKDSFVQFRREIAKEAENSRSGKKMLEKVCFSLSFSLHSHTLFPLL
jgi:hypothetical protein